jgi:quaternary ammonium compound-resistance protein SugE
MLYVTMPIFEALIERTMNWILLVIAGLFEVGFTTCLGKANESTGNPFALWITGFFVSLSLSMYLLYKATSGPQALPLGTGYAVWTGIGAVGTVLMGIFFFKEPVTFWKVFFIATLIASVIGLKMVSH